METILGLLCVVSLVQRVTSQITLQESGPVTVKPTETLNMMCTVTGASLTDGTNMHCVDWIRDEGRKLEWLGRICYENTINYGSSVQGRLTLTKDISKGEVYFKLTGMKAEESGRYHCVRETIAGTARGFDIWSGGTTVTVTAAEKRAPSVFPLLPCSGSLSASPYVTFGCLSTSYLPPPVDVSWNSGSITSGLRNFPDVLGKSGTYLQTSLLTVSADDFKNKKYTCNVNHKATGQTINKDIAVVGPEPKAPTVEVMQASCGETGSVDLVCLINGYNPNNIIIQWLLNGEPTSIHPKNSTPYKDSDGNFGVRSQVSVPKTDWNSGDSYTCRVSHPPTSTRKEDKIHKCPESGSSHPKVTVIPPGPKDLLITKQPKVTCEVSKLDSSGSLRITWSRSDGKRALPFTSDPESDFDGKLTVKSTLKISVADWDSEKVFTCTVKHDDLPSPIEKKIQKREVAVTDPTIYIFPPTKDELSHYDFVGLNCLLSSFSRKDVYVQWKKNGQVIDEDYYINTEPVKDDENETYIMYSRLTVEKSDWQRESTFTCLGALSKITSKDIKIEKSRRK